MTRDLITRLSKLDAPDREVDGEIWRYLMAGEPRAVLHGPIPRLTASVDAVIALTKRELPGANVLIGWGQTKETKPWARIGVTPSHDATGFNLATAICIALLRAKEAERS